MTDIAELLANNRIRRVPADPDEAQALLDAASRHLAAAEAIVSIDLAGAYILAYDAARKAVTAHMAHHGYTSEGGLGTHLAVGQYGETLGDPAFDAFDRMRRNRNRSQYGLREFSESEVTGDIEKARRMHAAIVRLLGAEGS